MNAWKVELAFILGATAIISLLQAITFLFLDNILWVYSATEVGFYYIEYFILGEESLRTINSVSDRLIFLLLDVLFMIVAFLPLIANILWVVPDTIWNFLQGYMFTQSFEVSALKVNLSPYYYVPFLISVHVLLLSTIRFVLNMFILPLAFFKNMYYRPTQGGS